VAFGELTFWGPVTGSNTSPGFISDGMSFVPSATYRLTRVVVGVGWFSDSNSVTFMDANNGGVPGGGRRTGNLSEMA